MTKTEVLLTMSTQYQPDVLRIKKNINLGIINWSNTEAKRLRMFSQSSFMVRARNSPEFTIIWLEKRFDLETWRGLAEIGVNLSYLIGETSRNGSEPGRGELSMGRNIHRHILKEWGLTKRNVRKTLVPEDSLKSASSSPVSTKLMMTMIPSNMFHLPWM